MSNRGYGPYNCYLCRRELNEGGILFNDVLATIRVFSGVPGNDKIAGGFAACDRHAAAAIEQAMRPLWRQTKRQPNRWVVTGYQVVLDRHGDPQLGRTLFVCRQKLFDDSDAAAPPWSVTSTGAT